MSSGSAHLRRRRGPAAAAWGPVRVRRSRSLTLSPHPLPPTHTPAPACACAESRFGGGDRRALGSGWQLARGEPARARAAGSSPCRGWCSSAGGGPSPATTWSSRGSSSCSCECCGEGGLCGQRAAGAEEGAGPRRRREWGRGGRGQGRCRLPCVLVPGPLHRPRRWVPLLSPFTDGTRRSRAGAPCPASWGGPAGGTSALQGTGTPPGRRDPGLGAAGTALPPKAVASGPPASSREQPSASLQRSAWKCTASCLPNAGMATILFVPFLSRLWLNPLTSTHDWHFLSSLSKCRIRGKWNWVPESQSQRV